MLQPLDDEIFNREIKSSFPGIGKTVMHIWDSQMIWLRRLQGENPEQWPSSVFNGARVDMLTGLISSSETLVNLVDSNGPEFLSRRLHYKTIKGVEQNDMVEDILYHVVNHGTYHRGQIVTILHELGVTELKGTDLILYVRSMK